MSLPQALRKTLNIDENNEITLYKCFQENVAQPLGVDIWLNPSVVDLCPAVPER